MYGTSSVVVVISWMGFVVPLEQTAARIALGITSLLTEVTILNMMNNSMPKVCNKIHLFNKSCCIASWFTSSDLKSVHCSIYKADINTAIPAILFTTDFPRSASKFVVENISVQQQVLRCSEKCAQPFIRSNKRKINWITTQNCLQRLVASTTTINGNFAGTKTYFKSESLTCQPIRSI